MALALAGLVTVQVLLTGLAALELAVRGDAKALLRGLVGFRLWHGSLVFVTLPPPPRGERESAAVLGKPQGAGRGNSVSRLRVNALRANPQAGRSYLGASI